MSANYSVRKLIVEAYSLVQQAEDLLGEQEEDLASRLRYVAWGQPEDGSELLRESGPPSLPNLHDLPDPVIPEICETIAVIYEVEHHEPVEVANLVEMAISRLDAAIDAIREFMPRLGLTGEIAQELERLAGCLHNDLVELESIDLSQVNSD